MEKLEAVKPINFGFRYYGCWTPMLAAERADKQPRDFGRPERIEKQKALFQDAGALLAQAGQAAPSRDGRRLAEYFGNKGRCAEIHMDYWREVALAANEAAAMREESKARDAVVPHAASMLNLARAYLRAYQEYMLDRTDEGMLASYWMVAGQYAYRYALPSDYKNTDIFYERPGKSSQRADRPRRGLRDSSTQVDSGRNGLGWPAPLRAPLSFFAQSYEGTACGKTEKPGIPSSASHGRVKSRRSWLVPSPSTNTPLSHADCSCGQS